jgi:hypothetical protein
MMARMCGKRLVFMALVVAGSVCLRAQDAARPEPSAVTGFVRFARGEAIADVRVSLVVARTGTAVNVDRSAWTTRTSVDGSYRFEAIPPGDYQVSVAHAGAVAKQIRLHPGSELKDIDFAISDGSSRRVVTARVVMNPASVDRQVPTRIGIGVRQDDGTLVIPLAPGDQRLVVRLPSGYFLDSATYGSAKVYSLEQVGGRRLTSGPFSITVPPEPQVIPNLVITLGVFR